jgi:superfamily I DNA/RNA helicase
MKQVTYSTEQTAIFDWIAGKLQATHAWLIVNALAGVGKTFTAAIGLLEHCPEVKRGESVLYAVFNKRNQLEAEKKIKHASITVKTWHSVGYGLLAKHWGRIRGNDSIEWRRVQSVLDSMGKKDCPKQVMFQCVKLVGILKNYIGIPTVEFATKQAMAKDCLPTDKQELAGWTTDLIVNVSIGAMKLATVKDKSGEISFGDMGGWLPIELGIIRPTYKFILADEGQDLNEVQVEMMRQLSSGRGCVIGDRNQAIYVWRGAVCNGLDRMKKIFNATELKLSQTFRCGKAIVKEACSLVPEYVAHESNCEGIVETATEDKMISEAKIGDAILSRVNAPLMKLCLGFIRANKSAKIEGRDIGKMLTSLVESLEATDATFSDKLNLWEQTRIAKATGWNATKTVELVQDQAATLRAVWEASTTIQDMLARINNLFQDSTSEYAKPCIVLSSVHKSKGLEWGTVYLLAETFNRNRPDATAESMAEEKNIQYVAITRAISRLVWVR